MAGDWIKLEHASLDKPEVTIVADELGIHPDSAFVSILRFWIWCDQQLEECNALNVTSVTAMKLIDRAVGVTGFAEAMCKARWLEITDEGVTIPNFKRHNGQTAKNRALTNERVSKLRRGRNAGTVTGVTPEPLQKPLPEKRRDIYNMSEIGKPIPDSLFGENQEDQTCVTDDTKKPSKEGLDFANWFKTLLPETIKLPAKWRENWAKVLDDMIRLDHRDKREIRDVCQWARSDEFWSKNFLSPKKLREKNRSGIQYFDVFKEAMGSAKAKEKPKSVDLNDFSTYLR